MATLKLSLPPQVGPNLNLRFARYIRIGVPPAPLMIAVFIPSVMDLNKTHLTNPLWKPHARFHGAVLYLSTTLIQCIALFLLWGNYSDKKSILVTWFAGLSPIFFWGMFLPA